MDKLIIALFFVIILSLFTVQPVFAESTFKVLKVVDGDTIQVDVRGNKETIRLLGINTPESVDPRRPVQCFGKEATNKLKSFVSGKSVVLVDEKTTQGNRDKYGRLLRYVYLPNSVRTFVNGEMVKQGYAFSYKQYPTEFLDRFNAWETYARGNNLGLWGSCPLNRQSTKKTTTRMDVPVANLNVRSNGGNGFSCAGKTKCGEMTSCEEAKFYLNSCGLSKLDGNSDGTPCEALCR